MNCTPIAAQFSMVQFREGPWEDIVAEASSAGLPIIVYGYTDWCSVCESVEATTFSDNAVARALNQEFIPVKYDMETGEGKRLALKFRCFGYPAFLVFGGDGRLWYRDLGGMDAERFLEMLQNARDPSKHLTLVGVSPEIDLPWPDFLSAALAKGAERRVAAPAEVRAYLAGQEDWSQEVPWAVISRFGNSLDGENFIIQNRRRLDSLYGRKELHGKLDDIVYRRIYSLSENPDSSQLDSLLQTFDTLYFARQDIIRHNFTITYAILANDWRLFMRTLSAYIDTARAAHPEFIAWHCRVLLNECDEEANIQQAVEWMLSITDDEAPIERQRLCAALLHKIGQDDLAESRLVSAIRKGNGTESERMKAEALLNDIRNNRER
jgi:thiol-disulfide isomerase/thioredoxin